MKFYSNQLQKIADGLASGQIQSALFYGPDHGLIEYSISEISKILKLPRKNLTYGQASVGEIDSSLNNISLFAEKELISVKGVASNPDAKTKELLSSKHHNILLLGVGELTPSSPMRKLFESEQSLAAIACYNDDEKSIEQIIRSHLSESQKRINPDAMQYLKLHLQGDRFIILNELEKLLTFTINKQEIDLDDVEAVISKSSIAMPDRLCLYFLLGSKKNYFQELDKSIANNIPSIWVIRAIIRYYINAYYCLNLMQEGQDLEKAISSVPNQIFFKYKPAFKKAVGNLDMRTVKRALENLYMAEKEIKSGGGNYKEILLRCFFQSLKDSY